jgi:ferredoxin--NADP+ reductase
VRFIRELAYSDYIASELPNDELIGELVREKLVYYPTVTREAFRHRGRISSLIESGRLAADLGLDRIDRSRAREMVADLTAILQARGFEKGNSGEPGDYVTEKAFVEK